MEESTTYQAIVRKGREEGRAEGVRHMLLLQGETKFGPPDAVTRGAIEAIDDVQRLEQLGVRLVTAGSWQELLTVPAPPRRRGPRTKN
jgi:hypothetical protein